jgi:hypothetical protein
MNALKLKTPGSKSLVFRPIWRNVEHMHLEMRIVTAYQWLHQCEAEHSGCKAQSIFTQNRVLPARVLDVSQNADVALVNPCDIEGNFNYLALSHCVGDLHH